MRTFDKGHAFVRSDFWHSQSVWRVRLYYLRLTSFDVADLAVVEHLLDSHLNQLLSTTRNEMD